MHEVQLTPIELFTGGMTGVSRHIKCITQAVGYNGIDNRKRGWQDNCDGAVGEMAFAKWLNVFWCGTVNIYRTSPDVQQYEVRTNAESWGDLILRERDKNDETIYVLVLSHRCPIFQLAGWITGAEGKVDKWFRDGDKSRPKAYFVPQSALHDMEMLRKSKGETQ